MSENNNTNSGFEINPLDINIAKIQFNLQKRLNKEIPAMGIAPVIETYDSKDPTRNISAVKVIYSENNGQKVLSLKVTNKDTQKEYSLTLAKGKKDAILQYLQDRKFFEDCKSFINQVDKK